MAEEQNPVTHGELVEIVRRLDDRISSMDRNLDERISSMDRSMDDRFQAVNDRIRSMERNINDRFEAVGERLSTLDRNMNQNLTEMRMDIRMLTRAMIGFYAFIIATVDVAFTLYKLFPNTS